MEGGGQKQENSGLDHLGACSNKPSVDRYLVPGSQMVPEEPLKLTEKRKHEKKKKHNLKKNLDQLYSSINHHRTTANLSDIVCCMSGGVSSMSGSVWRCLVVCDACLVVSGGVNVYL